MLLKKLSAVQYIPIMYLFTNAGRCIVYSNYIRISNTSKCALYPICLRHPILGKWMEEISRPTQALNKSSSLLDF